MTKKEFETEASNFSKKPEGKFAPEWLQLFVQGHYKKLFEEVVDQATISFQYHQERDESEKARAEEHEVFLRNKVNLDDTIEVDWTWGEYTPLVGGLGTQPKTFNGKSKLVITRVTNHHALGTLTVGNKQQGFSHSFEVRIDRMPITCSPEHGCSYRRVLTRIDVPRSLKEVSFHKSFTT